MHKEIHFAEAKAETRGHLCKVQRAVLHHAKETHPMRTALRIAGVLASSLVIMTAQDQNPRTEKNDPNINAGHQIAQNVAVLP